VESQFVTPLQAKEVRKNEDFLPLHLYPEGVDFGHKEIGALFKDGKVYKRIFYV
jgi:hypothetical protein